MAVSDERVRALATKAVLAAASPSSIETFLPDEMRELREALAELLARRHEKDGED